MSLKFNRLKRLNTTHESIIPTAADTNHCNVIVALNNLTDLPHFILHIARPDFTDYLTGICKCGWHVGRSGEALKPRQSCSLCYQGDGRQCTKAGGGETISGGR